MGSSPSNGRYEDGGSGRYQASQPTQSRSFRILQMMTDTVDDGNYTVITLIRGISAYLNLSDRV